MSWFEAASIASLAKSAIKEAQKTIDKALDIREEEDIKTDNISPLSPPPVVKKDLKEESESFFSHFGVSEKLQELNKSQSKDDSSQDETKKENEGIVIGGRMVESLWGSFTGSFFDNPKNEVKEEAVSSKTSSAPGTPSETVVATQPPRSLSSWTEDSSNSSSIAQLSADTLSPCPGNLLQSPFLEEMPESAVCAEVNLFSNESGVTNRDVGWEWGWDSSIMIVSEDSKLTEDLSPPQLKPEPLPQEDSLADDTFDTERFAKSRLIVGSVDSESSFKSQSEMDYSVPPVVEEEVFEEQQLRQAEDDDGSCSRIISLEEEEGDSVEEHPSDPTPLQTPPDLSPRDTVLSSPDSIILLDSSIVSPVDHPSPSEQSPPTRPQSLVFPFQDVVSSPDSIEVIGSIESLTSPSSIEVISRNSTEASSPTAYETISNTLSEDYPDSSALKARSSDSDTKKLSPIEDANSAMQKKPPWQSSQDDTEKQAITRQPISSVTKTIHQEEANVATDPSLLATGTEACEVFLSEEAKESFHSSTTSSSTLTVLDSGEQSTEKLLLEISDSPQKSLSTSTLVTPSCLPTKVEDDLIQSMNAWEIRKNLDKVDKDSSSEVKKTATQTTKDGEDRETVFESPLSLNAVLEMSSRSESSTETVTASIDSQHMTWSDIAPIEGQFEEFDLPTKPEDEDEKEDEAAEGVLLEIPETDQGDLDLAAATPEDPPESVSPAGAEDEERRAEGGETEAASSTVPSVDRELSPVSSDRSDALKVGSSGQSSGDEVETATSSDIEVISSPSIDGSSNGGHSRSSSFHVPPSMTSRAWGGPAQRGLRTFINEKAEAVAAYSATNAGGKRDNGNGYQVETVPSSMTASFTSISESEGDAPHLLHSEILQLEASRITQVLLQDINAREKGHRRNQSNLSETSESSSEPPTPEMEKLLKKLSLLTDILESRETKVLELSHVNASLQDSNTLLKSRLDELERLRKGNESTENLREEFTQRLVTMERKFQHALREKETTKKQLEEYKLDAATRRSEADVSREIEDKDTTIAELRKEGEKLSKQQLNYSNIVKKLRAKEKESEAVIKDQRDKVDTLSCDLDRARKQVKAKEEVERRQIDAIRQLSLASQRQEEEGKVLKAENAELEGKLAVLKEALEAAYKEMSELRKSVATRDEETQKLALSAEVSARQKVEDALSEAQNKSRREREALMAQIHQLQDTLAQAEAQSNRKERQQRNEIQDLLQRLSESESRTDEISLSVGAATRPLLRQMDSIQRSQAAQQAAWEGMEESLNKRLNEAQKASSQSAKKERESKEHLSAIVAKMSSIQTQVATLQLENTELKAKLKAATLRSTSLEEAKTKETHQLEALKNSFAEEILEVKHERDTLEQQLEMERTAATAEKKKSATYQEYIKERDRKIAQLQLLVQATAAAAASESRLSTPRSSPTPSLSHLSVSGSVNESLGGSHWGDEVFENSSWGAYHRSGSLYETLRGNNASTVDALTSTLRQREGEVHHLQGELSRLEAQKESLAQELVESSRRSEEHLGESEELARLKEEQKDREQKYNALLQMYGEKVEEVEELRLDLEDVKEMYKLQIDQLMQK